VPLSSACLIFCTHPHSSQRHNVFWPLPYHLATHFTHFPFCRAARVRFSDGMTRLSLLYHPFAFFSTSCLPFPYCTTAFFAPCHHHTRLYLHYCIPLLLFPPTVLVPGPDNFSCAPMRSKSCPLCLDRPSFPPPRSVPVPPFHRSS